MRRLRKDADTILHPRVQLSPPCSRGFRSFITRSRSTQASTGMVRPGRWPHARSRCPEHASGRGAGRGGRAAGAACDWLLPVARARSLRLLSASLRRRSGRRLRAASGPIRSQPVPAGEAAIGRRSVTKRDKGRSGGRRKDEDEGEGRKKRKKGKRKRRLLTG